MKREPDQSNAGLSQGQHLLLMGRKYPGGLDIVAGLALRNREGEITQITGLCIDPKAGESLGDALRRILPPGYELIWLPEDDK